MTREELKNWILSEYNEDTEDQLDYYINGRACDMGDKAYLYDHAENELIEMEVVHIISRVDNMEFYDGLSEDILFEKEAEYGADTSAEFIFDDDCCLVWFKYI